MLYIKIYMHPALIVQDNQFMENVSKGVATLFHEKGEVLKKGGSFDHNVSFIPAYHHNQAFMRIEMMLEKRPARTKEICDNLAEVLAVFVAGMAKDIFNFPEAYVDATVSLYDLDSTGFFQHPLKPALRGNQPRAVANGADKVKRLT